MFLNFGRYVSVSDTNVLRVRVVFTGYLKENISHQWRFASGWELGVGETPSYMRFET